MMKLLRGEPGGEIVRRLVLDGSLCGFAHAANLCEVHYDSRSCSAPTSTPNS